MSDQFKTGGGLDALASANTAAADPLVGKSLGDNRVSALLGAGGMGRVYLAHRRIGQYERAVALKVSPGAMFSEQTRQRFEREQATLAGLNHPNICQLYDARVTAEGTPFFVMEYVDGVSIDEFCAARALSLRDRIELVLKLVDAIGYAHANLVVHRDIKPSNILVTDDGQPKLLDFGVAKLLDAGDDWVTQASPLTPRYASPEQLLNQPVTVTTDIYQLGLLIYELVVGKPLREAQSLAAAMQNVGREQPANLPLEAQRLLPPEVLKIVEQALRTKDNPRYADVGALRADLTAFLEDRPVSATGTDLTYRAKLFIKRNIYAVLGGSVMVATLAALTLWYLLSVQEARDVAREEAQHARQVSDFLVETFAAANPQVTGKPDVPVREVLQDRLAHVEEALVDQPSTQARLLRTMALALQKLGEFQQAETTAKDVLLLIENDPSLGSEHRYHAQSILISILFETAQLDAVEPVIDQHIADTRADYPATSEEQIMAANRRATLHFYRGDLEVAAETVADLVEQAKTVMGPTHHQTLLLAGNLVAFYYHSGQLQAGLKIAEESYRTAAAVLPADNQQVLALLTNMASIYNELNRHEEALAAYTDYRDRVIQQFGSDHINVVNAQRGIGTTFSFMGRHAEAAEVQVELIKLQTHRLGATHPETLSSQANYANTLSELGRHEEALAYIDVSIEGLREQFDDDHYHLLFSRVVKTQVLAGLGRSDSQAYYVETRKRIVATLGDKHFYLQSLDEIARAFGLSVVEQ